MAFDKYVKLPGSERKPMRSAKKSGVANPKESMQVTIVLRQRPSAGKQPSLAELVASGERVSREEYAARYGADPKDVNAVKTFARANQLKVGQVSLASRTVALTGSCRAFAKAFQVQLDKYQYKGGDYRGRTGPVNIPTELRDVIVGVHGLDNRPQAKTHFRMAVNASAAAATSYTALQVARAYNFPTGVNGKGQTIAVIELGGGYKSADLKAYFKSLKISPAPSVSAVSVDKAKNKPTGDTNGPDTEVMLDIEVAGAVAPGAKIAVYFAPNTDAGFLDAINQAAMDKTRKPSVISISWGGPESSWTAQSLQNFNNALQAAAAVGVTVCAASGDNGSTDGSSDGSDQVDFPSSSPFSLACGGTRLDISGSAIGSEVVWNELPNNGATGGGVSATFPLPSYQANANVPPSANPGGSSGRGVPDVAGDADPQTGYQVQADGSQFVVGGTSAVAPLWAGLLALFNQMIGTPVGYLNPNLYQKVALAAGTFNDITSGNNGDYKAGPGWDACTGWGSPNGTAILKALSAGGTGGA
jgi:kumamolisin